MPGLGRRTSIRRSLPDVMSLLHRRGVKGYVTLNTLDLYRRTGRAGADRAAGGRGRRRRGAGAGFWRRPTDPRHHARLADPRLDANDPLQRRMPARGRVAGHRAGGAGPRVVDRRDRQDSPADRSVPLEVFVHGALVRGLLGPVHDQRIARRPQCQSRPVRTGLPVALRADLRRPRTSIWAGSNICSVRRIWRPMPWCPS